MSATVVYYPESYIQLLTLLKDRVLSGSAAAFPRANIQIGVSTNFNKICGCVLQVCIYQLSSFGHLDWPKLSCSSSVGLYRCHVHCSAGLQSFALLNSLFCHDLAATFNSMAYRISELCCAQSLSDPHATPPIQRSDILHASR